MSAREATARRDAGVLEVLHPGARSVVQDWPGRTGLQAKGLFPAGPMDPLAFRTANLLVGNHPGQAALEIPMGAFAIRAHADVLAALCGAEGACPTRNDEPLPLWQTFRLRPGDLLACQAARGPGYRLYLALAGGVRVPEVLGARALHTTSGIGGLDGRPLVAGDVLEVGDPGPAERPPLRLPQTLRPTYHTHWELEVVAGPHADPDFLTPDDWRELVTRAWPVALGSDREGVTLGAHRFTWARPDGGVAGGHPSNILDGGYPTGGLVVIGDVPTILGPDGPTSGGFTVIATVAHAALWKLGQLRPGLDTVRFREVDLDQADALAAHAAFALDPRQWERL